jgi:hypothetical protein
VILLLIVGLTSKVNRADSRAAQSAAQAKTALSAANDLATQVRSLGARPVVEPSTLPKPGPMGPTGPTGPQGPMGLSGLTGPQGPQGVKGATGATGPQGEVGLPGPKGDTGPAGKDGKDGAPGKDGTNGADGAPGKDGRGISSVTCDGPPLFSLTFFYTDGTSDTVTCTASK